MQNPIHDTTTINSERNFLNTLSCEDSKMLIQRLLEEKLARKKSIEKLSFNQESLWISNQTMAGNAAYHVAFAVRIKGDFNLEIFKNAFQQIVDRHESLRTCFLMQDENPMQQIKASKEVIIHKVDAFSWSQDYLNEKLIETYKIPFNLMIDPVFRIHYFCCSSDENILLLNFHHIAIDAYSMTLLVKELFENYQSNSDVLSLNKPIQNLENTYSHFTQKQHEKMLGEEGKQLKKYWLEKLGGELPVLNLQLDKPRPIRQTLNGSTLFLSFKRDVCAKLRALARANNTTLYTTLLSIFQSFLNRISGQDDIIVGTPMSSGRLDQNYTNTIGYFVNLVPMRANFVENVDFTAFLHQNKKTILEGIKHQAYPFSLLVKDLGNEKNTGTSPVFQAMFNLLNIRSSDKFKALLMPNQKSQQIEFGNLILESINLPQTEGQFDVVLEMYEDEEAIVGLWKYNTDLFTQHSMERIMGNFKIFVEGVLNNSQQLISHLPLLPVGEINQLLNQDSSVCQLDNSTIVSLFESQVKETPEAIALLFGEEQLSYRALNERANQLAHYLQNQGVGVGTLVSLCLERSIEIVISLLGILKSGGVYIPLDPTHPSERLGYFLADSQSKYLLTTPQSAKNLPSNYGGKTFYLDELTDILVSYSDENLGIDLHPSDLAYIIYTSGSTGRPKGVMLAHAGVVNRIAWQWKHYNFTLSDVILQKTTYCFDVSVWEFFMTLCYGAKLVLCTTEAVYNPLILSELISRHCITTLHFVPSMYRAFLSHLSTSDFKNLSSLRHVLLSGEALSSDLVGEHYKHLEIPMHNLYGPTEASVDVSYYEVQATDSQRISVPIGKAIANTQLYILDKHQQLVPEGITGELYLGGIGLAKGYLNRAELTAERFIDNPFKEFLGEVGAKSEKLYRTGDLAKWDTEGNVLYLGRVDFQVKVRGYRIELGEIEHQLQHYAGINQAVVLAQMDEEQNPYLVAYIEMGEGEEMSQTSELRTYLRKTLPDYMLPDYYVQVREWVLNSNGKLDRQSLSKPHLQNREEKTGGDLAISETTIGKELSVLWSEVLGQDLDSLKMNSHFFEMGGHSLKALRLVSRLHERLGIRIGVDVVFMNPVFGDLLKVLEGQKMDEFLEIKRLEPQDYYPTSEGQTRLWVAHQLQQNKEVFNVAGAFLMNGAVNITLFERAFAKIIERHESLRTTFVQINSGLFQVIKTPDKFDFKLEYQDCRDTSNQEEVDEIVQNFTQNPFDLAFEQLSRVKIIHKADTEFILLVSMHHLISDEWSLNVIAQELFEGYGTYIQEKESEISALSIHYKDYVAWHKEQENTDLYNEARVFWKNNLTNWLPNPQIKQDYERPKLASGKGETITIELSENLTDSLKFLSVQNGGLYMTLLACLKIVINYESGLTDVVMGSPVSGRVHRDLENQIGFYVNDITIRSQVNLDDTFQDFLDKLKDNLLKAYKYQMYPYDEVLREFNQESNSQYARLFDIGFTWHENMVLPDFQILGLELVPLKLENKTAKNDLWFHGFEEDENIRIDIEYNADIYKKGTILILAERIQRVIEQICNHPKIRLADLDLCFEEEKVVEENLFEFAFDF